MSMQETDGEHTVLPWWQGLAGTQDSPAAHATQSPPLQTMPVPQDVPLARLSDSMHTVAPVLHAVMPVRHGLPVTAQVAPLAQATQAPVASQTLSFPQADPGAKAVALSTHAGGLCEQSREPTWQALAGVHGWPETHAMQLPSWQTSPVPQTDPFGLLSDSMHCAAPVEQSIVPLRQGLPSTAQLVPSAHTWHTPSWHTELTSHAVPLDCS
jgi:hypothetical protein